MSMTYDAKAYFSWCPRFTRSREKNNTAQFRHHWNFSKETFHIADTSIVAASETKDISI